MNQNFDKFPSNIGEMSGRIPRKPYRFKYNRFEVWQGGQCVYSDTSNSIIDAQVINNQLNVTINDEKINKYIKNKFSFGEISTNLDRVMWSKDIFNSTGKVEKFNPDINSIFFQNGEIVKITFTIHDPNILIEFYGEEIPSTGEQTEGVNISNVKFLSNNHIRYENGKPFISQNTDAKGNNMNANRGIQIEPNISGGEGFTVTVFNMEGNHPIWGNNVQMAPKPMRITKKEENKIVLRGYGTDLFGTAFSDYGLTIHHNGNSIEKIILHMHDRNVDIEYFRDMTPIKEEPEIVKLAQAAYREYEKGTPSNARSSLITIYRQVKGNPAQLGEVKDLGSIGRAFLFMLDQNLSDDIDTLQMMTSVGYLCLSKAINKDPNNPNLVKDRLLLLRMGHEPFTYSVMAGLQLNSGGFFIMSGLSGIQARDAIYKMEIADLENNPILYHQLDMFRERRDEFDEMISRQFFMPEKTKENVIQSGNSIHEKMLEYLENKVIHEEDMDF